MSNQTGTHSKYNGFNLGLVKQPERKVKLEKIITNLKMENGQGQKMFEGNPATTKMPGVMDLNFREDRNKNGSTYVRIVRDEQTIYGSKITITYQLIVTNISEVNYYNPEYYWFGDKDVNKEVTVNLKEITDYLDETLVYELCDDKHKVEDTKNLKPNDTENGVEEIKQYILKVTPVKKEAIYTTLNKERPESKKDVKTSDTATIVAYRKLSQQDKDIEIKNSAKINDGNIINYFDEKDKDKDKKSNDTNYQSFAELQVIRTAPKEVHTNGEVKATTIITPPEGVDMITIVTYSVAGTIAMMVLAVGVVIIKKRTI